MCMGAVVVGKGEVRLEPDRPVVIPQRSVQVAFVSTRSAPIVVGLCKVRLEPDRLTVEPQLLINIDGSKPSLEPLHGGQLFLLNRWSRDCRRLLFRRRLLCSERCRM